MYLSPRNHFERLYETVRKLVSDVRGGVSGVRQHGANPTVTAATPAPVGGRVNEGGSTLAPPSINIIVKLMPVDTYYCTVQRERAESNAANFKIIIIIIAGKVQIALQNVIVSKMLPIPAE